MWKLIENWVTIKNGIIWKIFIVFRAILIDLCSFPLLLLDLSRMEILCLRNSSRVVLRISCIERLMMMNLIWILSSFIWLHPLLMKRTIKSQDLLIHPSTYNWTGVVHLIVRAIDFVLWFLNPNCWCLKEWNLKFEFGLLVPFGASNGCRELLKIRGGC